MSGTSALCPRRRRHRRAMVPAPALAQELMRRGHHVALVTDERGARFPGCSRTCRRMSCPPGGSAAEPLGWVGRRQCGSCKGRRMALRLFESFEPARGGRLRRLSGAAGAARRRSAEDPDASSTNRMPCSAGSTGCSRARSMRSRPPIPRSSGWPTSIATRSIWSAIRCATRCSRCATSPSRLHRRRHCFACS